MKLKPPQYVREPTSKDQCILLTLKRPAFEPDNGATSWYTEEIGIGTPPQNQCKFMIDTGTKNTWVSSTACTTEACNPHEKFDAQKSSSFSNNEPASKIDFGAWGSMSVLFSNDYFHLSKQKKLKVNFDVSIEYNGEQFKELIPDAGIGIPAHFPSSSPSSTLLLPALKENGYIPNNIVSFWYNRKELKGEALFGGIDFNRIDPSTLNIISLIEFPSDRECWLINLQSLDGIFPDGRTEQILSNVAFALDTGSSQFKGDADFINYCKSIITANGVLPEKIQSPSSIKDYDYPTLHLTINDIVYPLNPEQYFIQVSPTEWHLAFQFLAGCENEFLVGTTFLETVYTTFDFDNKYIILASPKFEK